MKKQKQQKRVLICEDDYLIANVLDQKLRANLNTSNRLAEDGNAAMSALELESFSLIITAFQLPFVSGFEIINFLKANKQKTPVMLLTDGITDDVMMNASLIGADDFLKKPYNSVELLIRARKLLS